MIKRYDLLVLSVIISLIFHALFASFVFFLKMPVREKEFGKVYEVSIYVPPARTAGSVNKSPVKPKAVQRASRNFQSKNTILVSKRKPYRKKTRKPKTSKKIAKSSLKAEKKKAKRILEERLRRLREEKYLEEKIASLKAGSSKTLVEKGGAGISLKSSVVVDPLLSLYVSRLVERIRLNWVLPGSFKGLETIVDVKINRNGEAVFIGFEKRSGDPVFDASCMRAVKKSFPFDPLPITYPKDYLEIGVRFKP